MMYDYSQAPEKQRGIALQIFLSAVSAAPDVFKQSSPDTFVDDLIKGADKLVKYVNECISG
jgi:hypothetical protein